MEKSNKKNMENSEFLSWSYNNNIQYSYSAL